MPRKASNSRIDSLERAGGPPNSPYRAQREMGCRRGFMIAINSKTLKKIMKSS